MSRLISYFPTRVPASRIPVASPPAGPPFSIVLATSTYLLPKLERSITKSTKTS